MRDAGGERNPADDSALADNDGWSPKWEYSENENLVSLKARVRINVRHRLTVGDTRRCMEGRWRPWWDEG